ncbi:MAG: hypothetical protein F9K22_07240 [Bacteroidetes bacterium]|nr:MAG: hypothetical protein F9K22_07240 [Bacteroidota bacterium]
MFFRLPYSNIVSGLPDLMLGITFLVTWIDPYALGDDMVPFLSMVMLLEFIIIHSSGFMTAFALRGGDKKKTLLIMAGLGAFYMLFAGAFAASFNSWWPVIAFGGLLLNRMLSVITGQAPEGKETDFAMMQWASNVFFYLMSVFAAIMLPLPELGVTHEQMAHLDMSGEFVDEPHRMMAWGFLYFTLVSAVEFAMRNTSAAAPEKPAV